MLKHYLTLGIISTTLLFNSCKKIVERTQVGEFNLVNQTTHNISFDHPSFSFVISQNSVFLLKQIQETSNKEVNTNNYTNPIMYEIGPVSSITIKFDGNKCLKMIRTSENSILNNSNYTSEKLAERTYKFTYTFTDADYNRAVTCP